jgi:hypothetical protein
LSHEKHIILKLSSSHLKDISIKVDFEEEINKTFERLVAIFPKAKQTFIIRYNNEYPVRAHRV